MKRSIALLSTVVALVGCASTGDEDTAQGEANIDQADPLARIRDAVKDVDQEHVVFADDVTAPTASPAEGATVALGDPERSQIQTALYGVDWFQKWGGGRSADHTWEIGTDAGKRCMWASVARFEAIMKSAPPELAAFLGEYTKWSGNFYNWNDDYSGKSATNAPAFGDAQGARLWAWRTHLTKWVSQTAKDGSCYLPTRKLLVDYVSACREHVTANAGELQGCEVRSR